MTSAGPSISVSRMAGMFLDRVLYSEAKHRGIALYGLETAQEQLTVFDHFSMRDQVRMLQETVDNYDKFSHLLEQLTQAYLARDLAQMVALNQKYMQIGDRKLADKLMDSLIYERNLRMVQRMRPRLKDGNAFVAIGALHLPGEKGVLRLLQNRGYTVSVVY